MVRWNAGTEDVRPDDGVPANQKYFASAVDLFGGRRL
jgi:hypothetical protein